MFTLMINAMYPFTAHTNRLNNKQRKQGRKLKLLPEAEGGGVKRSSSGVFACMSVFVLSIEAK